jgi:hypothetical protein
MGGRYDRFIPDFCVLRELTVSHGLALARMVMFMAGRDPAILSATGAGHNGPAGGSPGQAR